MKKSKAHRKQMERVLTDIAERGIFLKCVKALGIKNGVRHRRERRQAIIQRSAILALATNERQQNIFCKHLFVYNKDGATTFYRREERFA
jgi:hypothetical protein